MPNPGSKIPLRASLVGATDGGTCRHPNHIVGPAQSTSIKPIFGVASILLPFYPFSCAVVRLECMTHCWRIALSQAAASSLAEAISLAKRETGVEAGFSPASHWAARRTFMAVAVKNA